MYSLSSHQFGKPPTYAFLPLTKTSLMSNLRSCLECRRRKIRCDRNRPCSYCTRVRIDCIYATSSQPPRRARSEAGSAAATQSPGRIEVLEETVRRLEARLAEVEGRVERQPNSATSSNPRSTSSNSSLEPGSSFISNEPSYSGSGWAQESSSRLSPHRSAATVQLTDTIHARSMWALYLTDIDPLLKIVNHQYVEDTLLTYPEASAQGKTLLLAIFFAIFACKSEVPTVEYQSSANALERALRSANVRSQPSVPTLQALTIYLTCGRVNMSQDYLCDKLSLLVQLARKLQLHRDPAELGYLPSECEHRRRLWWHILALDVRTAEACGSDPIIHSSQIGPKAPCMVRDAALQSSTFPTSSHHDPCTFHAVVAVEMAQVAKRVLFSADNASDKADRVALSDRLHQELIEKYINRCDCADSPVCRLTIEWCKIYRDRLRILLLHWEKVFLRKVSHEGAPDTHNDLQACIDILMRVQQLRMDATYSRWAWLWHNCVEWDVSAVALCMIARGQCSPEQVQQAWVAIDSFFSAWAGSFGGLEHRKRWRKLEVYRDWVRAMDSLRM